MTVTNQICEDGAPPLSLGVNSYTCDRTCEQVGYETRRDVAGNIYCVPPSSSSVSSSSSSSSSFEFNASGIVEAINQKGDAIINEINNSADSIVAAVNNQASSLLGSISDLNDTIGSGFSSISGQLSSINSGISDINQGINDLGGKLVDLNGTISSALNDQTSLLSDINGSLAKIGDINVSLDDEGFFGKAVDLMDRFTSILDNPSQIVDDAKSQIQSGFSDLLTRQYIQDANCPLIQDLETTIYGSFIKISLQSAIDALPMDLIRSLIYFMAAFSGFVIFFRN